MNEHQSPLEQREAELRLAHHKCERLQRRVEDLQLSVRGLLATLRDEDVPEEPLTYRDGKTAVTLEEYIKELEKLPRKEFKPSSFYNADMDGIELYFEDASCYTKPFPGADPRDFEAMYAMDDDRLVGVHLYSIAWKHLAWAVQPLLRRLRSLREENKSLRTDLEEYCGSRVLADSLKQAGK